MVGAESLDFGPWSGADFSSTARGSAGIGADFDVPAHIRFVGSVARLIRRRLAQEQAMNDPIRPAVFLLEASPSIQTPAVAPTRVPMLDNGLTPITGRVWFVSPVVRAGRYVEFEECDDDTLFNTVTESFGLGRTPAILFDPRTADPVVRFYPDGLMDPDRVETLVLRANVTFERIFDAIERVYQQVLVTPEAQTRAARLWEDGDKWWPATNAEDVVQSQLKAGLITAFPTCTIRHEQPGVTGRLDLEIEESDPLDASLIVRHAIIELKVLRSFGSTGIAVSDQYTRDWVEKGVRQAAAYRTEKRARLAALCCFDMRKTATGSTCFAHVEELADELSVKLRVWYVYGTSERYRYDVTISTN